MVFIQKHTKKRPAPTTQGGPKLKKLHVEGGSSKVNDKKRSRPVTQALDARDPDSESEEDEIDVEEDELDDHKDEFTMQADSRTDEHKVPKDPNGLNQKKKATSFFLQPLANLKKLKNSYRTIELRNLILHY